MLILIMLSAITLNVVASQTGCGVAGDCVGVGVAIANNVVTGRLAVVL
jgi:hypothetical protein